MQTGAGSVEGRVPWQTVSNLLRPVLVTSLVVATPDWTDCMFRVLNPKVGRVFDVLVVC